MNRDSRLRWSASMLLLFSALTSLGAVYPPYPGNGGTDAGGAVGNGSLSFSDNGTTVKGTFSLGASSYQNWIVFYIDSKSGGFTTTKDFSDNSSTYASSVSGYSSFSSRATANFASGFAADYAILLSKADPSASTGTLRIYQLATGPSLGDPIATSSFSDKGTSWEFSFGLGDVQATGNYFKFQSTTVTSMGSGYRYLESFEGLSGTRGFGTVTFSYYNSYGVAPVPETTNAALILFGGVVLSGGLVSRLRHHLPLARRNGIN